MRMLLIAFTAVSISTAIVPATAEAGCYSCGTDDCCQDAVRNSSGKDICRHTVLYVGSGQSCHDCQRAGSSCTGTSAPQCDSQFGICEQFRTLLVVPHGETIDLELMTRPPVLEETERPVARGATACTAA